MADLSNHAAVPSLLAALLQLSYGVSANTRSAWSIANARRIIGYEPQDDSEVVYADEIRELMLEPARQAMVQGDARGSRSSR